MSDLVEFLLARIAEDEAVARKCAEMFPTPWDVADRGWRVRIYSSEVPETGDHAEPDWVRHPVVMEVEPDRHIQDPAWLSERVEHVVRHNPARVLAECEAKLTIIQNCKAARIVEPDGSVLSLMGDEALSATDHQHEMILYVMAKVYADHPDHRDEWRP